MPQLSKPLENFEKPGIVIRYTIASSTKIYKGSLVALNSAGYAVPLNPATASLRFIGVANETVANQSGGSLIVNVSKSGTFVFPNTGTNAQSAIGKTIYSNGDGSVTDSSSGLTNAYAVGTSVAIETASNGEPGLRIRINNHTI
jgi:hypothetical protein